MAILVYKLQQFDYEYANFDPYDILGVSMVSQGQRDEGPAVVHLRNNG